jgi:hypothetical protein
MRRVILISLGLAVSVTMLVAVFQQQNRLTTLKAERAQVLARLAGPAEIASPVAAASPPDIKPSSYSPLMELLKLRAEVSRLESRKRELAQVRAENERLRVQLASRGTNAPGAVALPTGYIRKSEAKLVGYATPEDTIQSFLWAIHNRNASSFLGAFGPEAAKQFEAQMQSPSSTEAFFKEADSLPGMHVIGKEAGDDSEVVLIVEIMPGDKPQPRIRFKQFEGQWKMVGGL